MSRGVRGSSLRWRCESPAELQSPLPLGAGLGAGFATMAFVMARPRSEEAQKKVLDTAVELVAEVGISGFTVDAVSKRSGVAKTTIYRRWRRPLGNCPNGERTMDHSPLI